MIRLEGVAKRYRRRGGVVPVLEGLELEVPAGSFVHLRGPSGAGKTTLLHIVGAMIRPSAGRVNVAGEEISSLPEFFLSRFRRERIGFIFQGFCLVEGLSALENVMLPLVPLGLRLAEQRRRARSELEVLGLADRAEFRARDLSGGERQRVAVARAFVMNPAILIADEPFASLDEEAAGVVAEGLKRARAEGRTVLLAAHEMPAKAAGAVDRVVRLSGGRIEP